MSDRLQVVVGQFCEFRHALRNAGIEADLHVFESHGSFFGAPEDDESMAEQVRFIERKLGVAEPA